MTAGSDPNKAIAGVLDTLRRSRKFLLDPTPRNVDLCSAVLSQCVQKIVNLMEGDHLACDYDKLRLSLLNVRAETSAIAGLLDSAAAFRRDMLRAESIAPHQPPIVIETAAARTVFRLHILG